MSQESIADEAKKQSPEVDKELNEALKATFPASDPVAVGETTSTQPDRPLNRRPAELDLELVNELARHVDKTHEKKQDK
ncbi:hypothetical protein GIW81_04225 [Hyphomicrobium sp. xq]|uniref:Uncharacterized protein n=1 Tax=Hyphomicrobium album TaxID=2665159 RepID=A0A6I3KGZ4_9HYPH|nr:hypothetical protein [Hyphomicrobium album]MTD93539.1 hypothetical protein [Hyphomicrobium album]